jgi:hypothetical protein
MEPQAPAEDDVQRDEMQRFHQGSLVDQREVALRQRETELEQRERQQVTAEEHRREVAAAASAAVPAPNENSSAAIDTAIRKMDGS